MTEIHLHELLLESTLNWKSEGIAAAYHSTVFSRLPVKSFQQTMISHAAYLNHIITYMLFTKCNYSH
jgi:hypothetical protein